MNDSSAARVPSSIRSAQAASARTAAPARPLRFANRRHVQRVGDDAPRNPSSPAERSTSSRRLRGAGSGSSAARTTWLVRTPRTPARTTAVKGSSSRARKRSRSAEITGAVRWESVADRGRSHVQANLEQVGAIDRSTAYVNASSSIRPGRGLPGSCFRSGTPAGSRHRPPRPRPPELAASRPGSRRPAPGRESSFVMLCPDKPTPASPPSRRPRPSPQLGPGESATAREELWVRGGTWTSPLAFSWRPAAA